MYKFSFAYEVILKETQPKVGLSKSSGSDQKQTPTSLAHAEEFVNATAHTFA